MQLDPHEFIRRFLIHVLPKGFHRIRHYGLLANGNRAESLARARDLLAVVPPPKKAEPPATDDGECRALRTPCPCCGSPMHIIETFEPGETPRTRVHKAAMAVIRIDTS
jgi:hypothetical protein